MPKIIVLGELDPVLYAIAKRRATMMESGDMSFVTGFKNDSGRIIFKQVGDVVNAIVEKNDYVTTAVGYSETILDLKDPSVLTPEKITNGKHFLKSKLMTALPNSDARFPYRFSYTDNFVGAPQYSILFSASTRPEILWGALGKNILNRFDMKENGLFPINNRRFFSYAARPNFGMKTALILTAVFENLAYLFTSDGLSLSVSYLPGNGFFVSSISVNSSDEVLMTFVDLVVTNFNDVQNIAIYFQDSNGLLQDLTYLLGSQENIDDATYVFAVPSAIKSNSIGCVFYRLNRQSNFAVFNLYKKDNQIALKKIFELPYESFLHNIFFDGRVVYGILQEQDKYSLFAFDTETSETILNSNNEDWNIQNYYAHSKGKTYIVGKEKLIRISPEILRVGLPPIDPLVLLPSQIYQLK